MSIRANLMPCSRPRPRLDRSDPLGDFERVTDGGLDDKGVLLSYDETHS